MDFDFNALEALVDEIPGVNYVAGLKTLTHEPRNLEQVDDEEFPWLLQTDGRGLSLFKPGSQVSDETDLIYLGYVRPNAVRYPDLSAPEIRRGVMADVGQVLDIAEMRRTANVDYVFDRTRSWETYDDPSGEWSLFQITERVSYHRKTIGS